LLCDGKTTQTKNYIQADKKAFHIRISVVN